MVKKILLIIIFLFWLFNFIEVPVFADMMNPEWLEKRCPTGEKEVVCSYSSIKPFGPRIIDSCLVYKNNPNYYYLVGTGSSFGGEERYCFRQLTSNTQKIYWIISALLSVFSIIKLLALTLLVELPIFYAFGFRDKKRLFSVFFANLISVFAFNIIGNFVFPKLSTWEIFFLVALVFLELMVVLFETLFIEYRQPEIKRVFITVIIANLISVAISYWLSINYANFLF